MNFFHLEAALINQHENLQYGNQLALVATAEYAPLAGSDAARL
jgi:hypothetical protein